MNLTPWRKTKSDAAVARPVDLLRRQMDRLFEDFLGEWPLSGRGDTFVPRLDVSESEREIAVTAELPGMTEKDVEVSFSAGRLMISGNKTSEREERDRSYHLVERGYGSFSRAVDLGDAVDPEKASAEFRNGVLTVRVPKAEGTKAKKIDIKTG